MRSPKVLLATAIPLVVIVVVVSTISNKVMDSIKAIDDPHHDPAITHVIGKEIKMEAHIKRGCRA